MISSAVFLCFIAEVTFKDQTALGDILLVLIKKSEYLGEEGYSSTIQDRETPG